MSVYQEVITIINVYAPNNRSSKGIVQKLSDWKENSSIIIVEDFSISLSIMNGISRKKINNEMENFHNTTNELHLIDIYGILHATAVEYVFFSSAHWLFSGRDHMLGHNNKFKTIEIIQNMFSNLNGWNWKSITRIFFLETDKYMYINNILLNKNRQKKSKRKLENTWR